MKTNRDKEDLANSLKDSIMTEDSESIKSIKSDIARIREKFQTHTEKFEKDMSEFLKDDSDTTNNLISDFWGNIQNFFNSLTTTELGAVVHVLVGISVYFALFNMISAICGDFLITYFKLETKYPKLAKWIQYRRTLKYYYIAVNTLVILFLVGYMIYVNLIILGIV